MNKFLGFSSLLLGALACAKSPGSSEATSVTPSTTSTEMELTQGSTSSAKPKEIWLEPYVFQAHLTAPKPGESYTPLGGHLFDPATLPMWKKTREHASTFALTLSGIQKLSNAQLSQMLKALKEDQMSIALITAGPKTGCLTSSDPYTVGQTGAQTQFTSIKRIYDLGMPVHTILMDGAIAHLIGAKLDHATQSNPCSFSLEDATTAAIAYVQTLRSMLLNKYPAFPAPKFAWNINLANWKYSLESGDLAPAINNVVGYGLNSKGPNNPNATPLDARPVVDQVVKAFAAAGEPLDFVSHESPFGSFIAGTITGNPLKEGMPTTKSAMFGTVFQMREAAFRKQLQKLGMRAGRYFSPHCNVLESEHAEEGACLWKKDPACSYPFNKKFQDEMLAHLAGTAAEFPKHGLPPTFDVNIIACFDNNVPTVALPEYSCEEVSQLGLTGSVPCDVAGSYPFFQTARKAMEFLQNK